MPAEIKHSVSLKGSLDVGTMRVTEITKAGEFEYDLMEVLKRFHDAEVVISITEKTTVEPVDSED
ncbi:hypothetical protein EVJ32_04535 [Exiguobacterium sp. SH5S4]|uniref:YonK family protein n=1 Tax=Exiguobacterium sp. SH5S4 TaxID=2510961 RepID=UPI00104060B0|nr:YonK family protein [Exiguobacterium sp. SH5S4]TCI26644.1 hypothetical protein EVJ32_04535 [Exiguobacterium sp. SH5S4]